MAEKALFLKETSQGLEIRVHAAPGAKRSGIRGLHGRSLKISIAAPPEDGRANKKLINFLAELLGVAKRDLSLIRGDTSREKVILAKGISASDAQAKLAL